MVDTTLRGLQGAMSTPSLVEHERSGGPRTQLHLTCADGKDGWFIVNDPGGVAAALRGVQDSNGA